MSDAGLPDLDSVRAAARRISGTVRHTPLVRSHALSRECGADVLLKLEIEQPTGSFKIRGAGNAIRARLEAGTLRGVTTASTGNHARAVTHVGTSLGVPVHAFMASNVAETRISVLREMRAEVDLTSPDQNAAIHAAAEFADQHAYAFIPPFDHPDVISGQGTTGLELAEDEPDLDTVVVQVSGGGLAGGIGVAVHALCPSVEVVGVCAANAPAMQKSLAAGHPVSVPETPSVASSLMGDLGPDNRYTFRLAQQVIDRVSTVTEADILAAARLLHDAEGVVVEPSAAVGAAYLRAHPTAFQGQRVALILTGGFV